MKEHLEQGCKSCSKIVSVWQRVRQTAEAKTNYRPPSDAVRIAKASFAGSNLTVEQKRTDSLAELLFDSFLQPALEGVRSSSIGSHPEIAGHNQQVTLSNLRGCVVQATTNQFGEFCQEN